MTAIGDPADGRHMGHIKKELLKKHISPLPKPRMFQVKVHAARGLKFGDPTKETTTAYCIVMVRNNGDTEMKR